MLHDASHISTMQDLSRLDDSVFGSVFGSDCSVHLATLTNNSSLTSNSSSLFFSRESFRTVCKMSDLGLPDNNQLKITLSLTKLDSFPVFVFPE